MTKTLPKLDQVETVADLQHLQRCFAEIIRKPLSTNDQMLPDSRTAEMIMENDRTDSHGRMQFYAQQYWWRIQGSFDEDFPTVKKLVSQTEYLKLRNEYLIEFPSISFTLRHLGSRFPIYLKEKNQLLADAATFDWAKMQVFEARSFKAIDLHDVEKDDFAEQLLYLQPYVKLLKLDYPVNEINMSELISEDSAASNTISKKLSAEEESTVMTLEPKQTCLAVHRLHNRIYSKMLSSEQFLILKKIEQGIALDQLENEISEDALNLIQTSFSEWMALNWLSLETPFVENEL